MPIDDEWPIQLHKVAELWPNFLWYKFSQTAGEGNTLRIEAARYKYNLGSAPSIQHHFRQQRLLERTSSMRRAVSFKHRVSLCPTEQEMSDR